MRYRRYCLILLCGLSALRCDACGAQQESPTNADCLSGCKQSRQSLDVNRCINLCKASTRGEISQDPKALSSYCAAGCEDEAQRRNRQAELYCGSLCEDDADGDGVFTSLDRCDKTPAGSRVAYDGCPDEDGDGIADDRDRCPTQGGAPQDLDPDGCPASSTACQSSYCASNAPPTCQGAACLREQEVPLLSVLPSEYRRRVAERILSIRPHREGCPGISNSVPQPHMVKPPFGLTVLRAFDPTKTSAVSAPGAVKLQRVDDTLVPLEQDSTATDATPGKAAYQEIDVEILFDPVEAPCPVAASSYALKIEYYFCDALPGLDERGHLEEAGFCRWLPLEQRYGVEAGKAFFYTFKIAELLSKLYTPHINNSSMNPSWIGPIISLDYKKIWFKIEAVAYNGNGVPNASGPHTNASYLVIYTVAKGYELSKIPGEEHQ